jgi:hypothetical protein
MEPPVNHYSRALLDDFILLIPEKEASGVESKSCFADDIKILLDLENENNCINLIAIYTVRAKGREQERKGIWLVKKTDATLRYVCGVLLSRESSSSHAEFEHFLPSLYCDMMYVCEYVRVILRQ